MGQVIGQGKTFVVIVAVAMVSAIGGLVFNTMPLLLIAVSNEFGMGPKQLSALSLTAGVGYLLGTLSGPFWVERVNWRFSAFVFVGFAPVSFLIGSQVSGLALFGAFGIFGLACALAIALAMRALAEMPDAERAFGTRLSVELWTMATFLLILPIVFIARGGFAGAMYGMAAMTIFLGLGALLFPKRSSSPVAILQKGFPTWRQASPAWILLALFVVYLAANVGLYWFLAVIVGKFSPSPEQFGLMFLVLKFGAIIGARAGLKLPHGVASIILLIGVAGMWLAPNFTVFMVSSWIWEFGFTLGCLYLTASIARFDNFNKLIILVPAAFGISMIVGGGIAGLLLDSGSAAPLYTFVVFCSFLPVTYVALSKAKPPSP